MTTKLLTAALCLAALLLLVGFTYRPAEPTKWEYRVATIRGEADDNYLTTDLNAAGLGGWELVAVENEGRGRRYFFKRPK